MPRRQSKSLEEVEEELEGLGLTRQSAAAIVRLANTLKQTRKLRAEHIEQLSPDKRIHPPSPLSRQVWNQSEIEGLAHTAREAESSSHNETSASEATSGDPPKSPVGPEPPQLSPLSDFTWIVPLISSGSDVTALGDVFLSSMDPTTLTDVTSRVDSLSISQDYPPDSPNTTSMIAEDAEEIDLHTNDGSKWW
ncbi:hypothetical protein TARUN_9690 [Trichoderma arundinaceum]|uniref:Uncharacterized protein n=1 Tax=Trichoderma arundinaceum TaxID=490622 RepID=A0A395N8X9_TRIAR|nr:hypothetical protein TARUN_9690 [Trichoderma arundinaceum]